MAFATDMRGLSRSKTWDSCSCDLLRMSFCRSLRSRHVKSGDRTSLFVAFASKGAMIASVEYSEVHTSKDASHSPDLMTSRCRSSTRGMSDALNADL